jgi:hypothetical protein
MTDTPPGAATPSSRTPRTRTELEALVLTELRMSWQCGGAIHVTVVAYDNYRVGGTWEVASCNPGASDPVECERALSDIVLRLQQQFESGLGARSKRTCGDLGCGGARWDVFVRTRARVQFESSRPRHAVGLTGASQVAACTLAAGLVMFRSASDSARSSSQATGTGCSGASAGHR